MKRGTVVEVNWPFSDLSGGKVRPAVVVQADYIDGLVDDTILVKITGKCFGIPGTEAGLDPAIETASGLVKTCYASCKDLLTLDEARIIRTVGYLSDAAMQRIDECLKQVLELS